MHILSRYDRVPFVRYEVAFAIAESFTFIPTMALLRTVEVFTKCDRQKHKLFDLYHAGNSCCELQVDL